MDRLLNHPAEMERREALLDRPHVRALEPVRAPLLALGRAVPHFDPLDGGADAQLLLLLETPGPGAEPLRFVSRDNWTGTGANLRRFLAAAEIARADTVIWNAVPWVVHAPGARNRPVRAGELRDGMARLPALLERLPRLAAVVLAGAPARAAEATVRRCRPDAAVLFMPHPSPTIVCTSPAVGAHIATTLAEAARLCRVSRTSDESGRA